MTTTMMMANDNNQFPKKKIGYRSHWRRLSEPCVLALTKFHSSISHFVGTLSYHFTNPFKFWNINSYIWHDFVMRFETLCGGFASIAIPRSVYVCMCIWLNWIITYGNYSNLDRLSTQMSWIVLDDGCGFWYKRLQFFELVDFSHTVDQSYNYFDFRWRKETVSNVLWWLVLLLLFFHPFRSSL